MVNIGETGHQYDKPITIIQKKSRKKRVGSCHNIYMVASQLANVVILKGGSRGVSKVSRNWSDHLWLVFACISLIMSMLPYSYTFMRWKPVINVSQSALGYTHIDSTLIPKATSHFFHQICSPDHCSEMQSPEQLAMGRFGNLMRSLHNEQAPLSLPSLGTYGRSMSSQLQRRLQPDYFHTKTSRSASCVNTNLELEWEWEVEK